MTTIVLHDPSADDADTVRAAMYDGTIVLHSPSSASLEFCAFTRELIEAAFHPLEPETAQFEMPIESYIDVLSALKPHFIHHPRSKEYVRAVLEERGCDLDQTFMDVPRLRTSTSDDYLTTGIAYAWHPHRDTWYSAPPAQINFWMPVYPIVSGNAMAFHPEHFDAPVPNDSSIYNYYEWNQKYRANAASNVSADTRPLPRPTVDIDLRSPLVLLPRVGGLIAFSGQHLHSSVPNQSGRTRFSIDFRVVHVGDIAAGRCAPTRDRACTGSSIRDFVRASDGTPMPEHIVALFADGTETSGDLVYSARSGRRGAATDDADN
jgi:hypothetical protein